MIDSHKYLSELAKLSGKHEIERYSEINFFNTFTPYEGIPKKHPYDKNKVMLICDPFSEDTPFYEFPVSSIGRIDELDTLSSENGSTGIRVRIWIQKGTVGIISRKITVG